MNKEVLLFCDESHPSHIRDEAKSILTLITSSTKRDIRDVTLKLTDQGEVNDTFHLSLYIKVTPEEFNDKFTESVLRREIKDILVKRYIVPFGTYYMRRENDSDIIEIRIRLYDNKFANLVKRVEELESEIKRLKTFYCLASTYLI